MSMLLPKIIVLFLFAIANYRKILFGESSDFAPQNLKPMLKSGICTKTLECVPCALFTGFAD